MSEMKKTNQDTTEKREYSTQYETIENRAYTTEQAHEPAKEYKSQQTQDKKKKSIVKSVIVGVIALGILGGVGCVAVESIETKQEQKAQEAYVQVVQNQTQAAGVNVITKDEAKQIAFDTAGVKETDVKQLKVKLDTNDDYNGSNQYVYEVDFKHDGLEYEFEIDAVGKNIINTDIESWVD